MLRGRGRELLDVDQGGVVDLRLGSLVDDDLGGGVVQLESGLAGLQCGVDGCECSTNLPGGEHGDDKLDPVGQHRGHHVADTDAVGCQHGGGSIDPLGEVGVGQIETVIVQASAVGVLGSTPRWKGGQLFDRRLHDHNLRDAGHL